MINDGQVEHLYNGADTSHGTDTITDTHVDTFLGTNPNTPILLSYSAGIENEMVVSEWSEKGNKATYEWLKMYGVLFNKEKEAEEVYDSFEARYDCLTENAALIVDDMPNLVDGPDDTPNVLWAYRVSYEWAGVTYVYWDVKGCSGDPDTDNYYCDFAKHCHAELENPPDDEGGFTAVSKQFYSDADFFNFAAKAEYWIYPGYDFNEVYVEVCSSVMFCFVCYHCVLFLLTYHSYVYVYFLHRVI